MWGARSDATALIYNKTDVREGGIDQFRCGLKSDSNIHGTTHYLGITKNSGFVSTETIDVDGKRLCASLKSALTHRWIAYAAVLTRLELLTPPHQENRQHNRCKQVDQNRTNHGVLLLGKGAGCQ